ncbi:hypothetical protein [Clostridium sp.]|uniref:hypothetical protein n=1 Tax=Clostridium sp. TaxID=1506 RepID=UPI003D6CD6BE
MNPKSNEEKLVNIAKVGNFTKAAVENLEENIVEQKDYLEKVWVNQVPHINDKFH